MSSARRVQQWVTFGRMWYLFDAKWQNPFDASTKIVKVLSGSHKPIYHNDIDCGDHVVVINSAQIALPGDEWERRVFYHHTGYAQGASWTLAHQVHEKDKTMVFRRAIYHALDTSLLRHARMCRLHIYPDEEVPEEILRNVSAQLRQMRAVPKRLDHYTEDEVKNFPKLFEWPKDYVLET
ncbi:39S ribosomal protein L13, mitochondrial [Hyalella azteca]|uniref:39S ribosomal protein L13, mitochondrial n=1 Tax=Hyalella azteca TaxID=294128 RepID=A0A8B7NQA4_HYAAZ|nr:39S ribosomal protein L13, mitochondrial [Hyalella azteca]